MNQNLYEQFRKLTPAISGGEFDAIRLSKSRLDFLGKTSEGSPVILIKDSSPSTFRPGFQLKYLKAEFHTTCLVRADNGEANGQFAIISCEPTVPELHEMFVRSVAAIVSDLSLAAGTDEIQSRLQNLADLFRNFSKPPGRELTGLWAELYTIVKANNIADAVRAWRNKGTERFDFSWNNNRLEVKATLKSVRTHDFALEQLTTPSSGVSYVASFLMQELNGGSGIVDLAAIIESAISGEADLRQKLWKNITAALGSGFNDSVDRQFDISYADRHAVLYHAADIPLPRFQHDPRITGVRFVSDLSGVTPTATGIEFASLFQ